MTEPEPELEISEVVAIDSKIEVPEEIEERIAADADDDELELSE